MICQISIVKLKYKCPHPSYGSGGCFNLKSNKVRCYMEVITIDNRERNPTLIYSSVYTSVDSLTQARVPLFVRFQVCRPSRKPIKFYFIIDCIAGMLCLVASVHPFACVLHRAEDMKHRRTLPNVLSPCYMPCNMVNKYWTVAKHAKLLRSVQPPR